MSRPSRPPSILLLSGVGALAGLLLFAPLASASVAQEEQAGSRIVSGLESGRLHCAQVSGADFDHVGEYLMGRTMGSPSAHEAMNEMMSAMLGGAGEQQMHEAMGRRFAGCGGGRLPAGFGRMMGALNAMGMMGGGMMGGAGARGWNGPGMMGRSWNGPGMMGGRGWGPGMMGGSWFGEGNDSDGPSTGAVIGMLVALVLVVGLILAAFAWRRRPADGPAEILKRRYAGGEISSEEYRARLDALR